MRRHNQIRRAKAVLLWVAAFFVCAQVALDVVLDVRYPESFDGEFALRLATLRARIAEAPKRPLMLLVGSSRTDLSFIPEILPALRTQAGADVCVFNFSHLGAGPAMNLVEVRRLLRAGIRPDWLVLELMPSQLGDSTQNVLTQSSGPKDLRLVARYRGWVRSYGRYFRGRLVPCCKHRSFILRRVCPGFVQPAELEEVDRMGIDRLGGNFCVEWLGTRVWQLSPHMDPNEIRARTDAARSGYLPALQRLELCKLSDRTTRELLDLCRHRHIQTVLLRSPEGTAFQSWYSTHSRELVDDYCARISREYGLPVVDGRNWLEDVDFSDSHHALLSGATHFTRRLGREVLQPLAAGELSAVAAARDAKLRNNAALVRR